MLLLGSTAARSAVNFLHTYHDGFDADTVRWALGAAAINGHRIHLLTIQPHRDGESMLPAVNRGKHDDDIARVVFVVAEAKRTLGVETWLRFAHEPNLPAGIGYAWSGIPADYVPAFRRVAAIACGEAEMVWSPNVLTDDPRSDIVPYWPGSDAVDRIGIDGYNWGTCRPDHGGTRSFANIFSRTVRACRRLGPNVPVFVAETACPDDAGTDQAAWVRKALKDADRLNLDAVAWFDEDKECRWRLKGKALKAWRNAGDRRGA